MEEIKIWVIWQNDKFKGTVYDHLVGEDHQIYAKNFFDLIFLAEEVLKTGIKEEVDIKRGIRFIESRIRGKDFKFKFEFHNVQTLLKAYTSYISFAALSRVTKINQTLLSQYASGIKKPRKKQEEKIIVGIQKIATDLSSFNLLPPDPYDFILREIRR